VSWRIDRPLVIRKEGPPTIIPHENWRGQFSRGTYTSGAVGDCGPGQTTGCTAIAWPGYRTNARHQRSGGPDIRTWFGGLVDGMRDASGQMYMRNRYYDPAATQFTQTDPIGLDGGLNAYAFAAGTQFPIGIRPAWHAKKRVTIGLSVLTSEQGTIGLCGTS
jgi:RHS repeat-associated protein